MALHRRQVLQLAATGCLAGIAGCVDPISGDQQTDADAWPQFRGGPAFGGTRPAEAGPGDELTEAWAWVDEDVEDVIADATGRGDNPDDVVLMGSSSPVVLDSTVVVEVEFGFDTDRVLVGLDEERGDFQWVHTFDDAAGGSRPTPLALSPALSDGRVYHVVPDGQEAQLVALDVATGDPEWRDASHPGAPVVRDETLYVVGHGAISAYDLDSGEHAWTTTDVHLTNHRATVTESSIVAMDRGEVVSYDRDDGDEQWRAQLADPGWCSHDVQVFTAPVIAEGRAISGRSKQLTPQQERVGAVSFDPDDGDIDWEFGPSLSVSHGHTGPSGAVLGYPAVADGLAFATATGSELIEAAGADPDRDQLIAFDIETGAVEWTAPAWPANAPVVAGDIVYVVGWNQVVAISTDGELVGETDIGGREFAFAGSPAIANGRLYAPESRGGVVAFGE